MSDVISTTFKAGRYKVEMSISIAEIRSGRSMAFRVDWTPHPQGKVSARAIAAYRRGRDAFVAELAHQIGGKIAVVEPAGDEGSVTLIEPAPRDQARQ